MTTVWETSYIVRPPPTALGELRSPTMPTTPTAIPEDSPPSYNFNKNGIEKVNFSLPCNYVFFEEKNANGCPKVLKIHLLGHERCIEHFVKYSDTVEALEFYGCLEYMEKGFKICSMMNKLKDVRFYLGRVTPQIKSPVKSRTWEMAGLIENINGRVGALRIVTDIAYFSKLSKEHRININEYVEMIMEYACKQFKSIQELRLEIPDSDRHLSLARNLLHLPNLPKNPRIEINLDYRIYAKIEQNPNPRAPKRSPSFAASESPENDAAPTCSSSFQNREEKAPSHVKAEVAIPSETEPVNPRRRNSQLSQPEPPIKNYSYEMTTAERLLHESATPSSDKNANNKRPGDPLVNPSDPKRQQMHKEEIQHRRDSPSEESPMSPPVHQEREDSSSPNEDPSSKTPLDTENISENETEPVKEPSPVFASSHHVHDNLPGKRGFRDSEDRDPSRQTIPARDFQSSYYRREDLRDSDRRRSRSRDGISSESSYRRDSRSFPYRGRGNPRGQRARGRGAWQGRPYQDRNRSNYDGGR